MKLKRMICQQVKLKTFSQPEKEYYLQQGSQTVHDDKQTKKIKLIMILKKNINVIKLREN